MRIIEDVTAFDAMLTILRDVPCLVVPLPAAFETHPAVTPTTLVAVTTPTDQYLVSIGHTDAMTVAGASFQALRHVWTPNKKHTLHLLQIDAKDVEALEYLATGTTTPASKFYTSAHVHYLRQFSEQPNLNRAIPLMRHMEFLNAYSTHLWAVIQAHDALANSQPYHFLTDIAMPVLQHIEAAGLQIDPTLISAPMQRHVHQDRMYSDYNLFTRTGRCSNAFGGVNYAALPKKDGSRRAYISRHTNGYLVQADFESFHLRLVADMIGYRFPLDMPVHEYLGRQYFNKTVLTPDEYDESKRISFQLLYGESHALDVPEFFVAVRRYVARLMHTMTRDGCIYSPYFQRPIYLHQIQTPTPAKVFNYMIQLAETESNMAALHALLPEFATMKSRLVLYTYDSILIDYDITDGPQLLTRLITQLAQGGKFPLRVSYGVNYHELTPLARQFTAPV